MIGNKSRLEKWIGIPAVLKTKHGQVEGCVKYGIRIPCAGGMVPLKTVEVGSKEKVGREGADYWFVNEEETNKTRLLTANIRGEEIRGYGADVEIFKYTINKKETTEGSTTIVML